MTDLLASAENELAASQADEIERLTNALAKANDNHETFERLWYLACDERDDVIGKLATITADRDRLLAEVKRLSFYETTSAGDAIRMLRETEAERDRYAKVFEAAKKWRPFAPSTHDARKWPAHEADLADAIDAALAAGKEQT